MVVEIADLHFEPRLPGWTHSPETVLQIARNEQRVAGRQVARVVLASLLAFWAGEFVNSFVLAKMKLLTSGRYLWMRTIGSTICGEGVDSAVFYPCAFLGVWSTDLVIKVMISNYVLKVLWEVCATPITYQVVGFLKRAENEDFFDRGTNFTPFSLET
jgi:uncharacterized PurR-regulated membrane protein YhhQ (DUF165 family)